MELLLSGRWLLEGENEAGEKISLPIDVPGFVHPCLEQAGLLPPLFWGKNAEKAQWVETKTWTFSRFFDLPSGAPRERAELVFGGIDTVAEVFLNGQSVAKGRNMFTRVSARVGAFLKEKDNELRVVVSPYTVLTKGKPDRPAAFRNDRVHVRRVQCTFWWDWVERFIGAGIWKDVRLTFPEAARLTDLYAFTHDIAGTSASVRLRVRTENAVKANCRFSIALEDPDGHLAWHEEGRVFLNEMSFRADLRAPRLWWPAGYGDQPLYTLRVTLFDENGTRLEEKTEKLGLRTVRFELLTDETEEELARTREVREKAGALGQTEYAHPGQGMILLVNGRRVFGKGGNWVPPSPFAGTRTEEEIENLIALAKKGNMNFLRVWGGGEYEPDIFYDLCDRYGILLMHDFMLSCGHYPDDDPDFVTEFRAEVQENVAHLKNHACIAFWNANNENTAGFDWDDPATVNQDLLESVYLPVLNDLDPARDFRPGSPYGGFGNEDLSIGDNHVSWWWRGAEKIDPSYFDVVGRFTTESPLGGYGLPQTLKKFLPEADPDSPETDYHIKTNAYFAQLGWPTVHGRLKKNADVILGHGETRAQQLFRYAFIQYEWARMTIEGSRRAKWYCAALQFWMYNDCWPAVGYALVDYYGQPKAGWYASRRAFAPLAASLRKKDGFLELWGLNDTFLAQRVTYELLSAEGQTLVSGEYELPENENAVMLRLPEDTLPEGGLLFLRLCKDGRTVDRARWCDGWLSALSLPAAEVEVSVNEKSVTVVCRKGPALGVAFDGAFVPEDNFFDLLPGETRTVPVSWEGSDRTVTVYGYNL